jgi:hypothetical protein
MRRPRVQPKDHRLVPIPHDLRDAMREVHRLLRDAESDPDIAVDYDDAIQVDGLCAGAISRGETSVRVDILPRRPRRAWALVFDASPA